MKLSIQPLSLFVPLFPWENDPTRHFVFVYLVTVVIYFDLAWLVVYECGESDSVFSFAEVDLSMYWNVAHL